MFMNEIERTLAANRGGGFGPLKPVRCLLSLVVCVLLLPVPVPMPHRHDAFGAPQALASHLAQRHPDSACECLAADETHWHFVLPSRFGDQRPQNPADDGLPIPMDDYVGSSVAAVPGVSSAVLFFAGIEPSFCIVWFDSSLQHRRVALDPRRSLAMDEMLRHRCALSCVMRC